MADPYIIDRCRKDDIDFHEEWLKASEIIAKQASQRSTEELQLVADLIRHSDVSLLIWMYVDDTVMRALAREIRLVDAPPGTVIVAKGSQKKAEPPPKNVYVLLSGKLVLERKTDSGFARTELRRGEIFGNMLSIEPLPPMTTYFSFDHCRLVVIPFHAYCSLNLVQLVEDREVERRAEFIKKKTVVPCFEDCSPSWFEAFARKAYKLYYNSYETITNEGEIESEFFFLLNGQLKMLQTINMNALRSKKNYILTAQDDIRVLEIAALHPGEYFGELGLLKNNPNNLKNCAVSSMQKDTVINSKDNLGKEMINILNGIDFVSLGTVNVDEKELCDLKVQPQSAASIIAHTSAVVLVWTKEAFYEFITGTVWIRMSEYAKGYPSVAALRNHLIKCREWDAYKLLMVKESKKKL